MRSICEDDDSGEGSFGFVDGPGCGPGMSIDGSVCDEGWLKACGGGAVGCAGSANLGSTSST